MLISKVTQQYLVNAGWFPERNIDISSYESKLQEEGYILNSKVKIFLIEFGGLSVNHPHHKLENRIDRFHLDPIRASVGIYREKVEVYEERVGEKLVVIGEAYREHMYILMSLTGRVYAACDDIIIFLGNSDYEALETLCESKEIRYILLLQFIF